MAYELKPWKKENCVLSLNVEELSLRETFSREINETYGEGGGLNADYRTVEAVAKASNLLGLSGLKYKRDFVFKTGSSSEIIFDFRDKVTKEEASKIFRISGHLIVSDVSEKK